MGNSDHETLPVTSASYKYKYKARNQEEIESMVKKAKELVTGSVTEPVVYCFIPGGKYTDGTDFFTCCYCDHETAYSIPNMKGHINIRCPGVPDDVRADVQKSTKKKYKRMAVRNVRKDSTSSDSDDSGEIDDAGVEQFVDLIKSLIPETDIKHEPESDTGKRSSSDGEEDYKIEYQIKKAKLTKLRKEVEEYETSINEIKSRTVREIERIKYYQGITKGFDTLVKAAEIVIKSGSSHRNQ